MIFDMTKRQGGGGNSFPLEHEIGVATVSELSDSISVTLTKPLKNGVIGSALLFFGWAEGSESWTQDANDNWSQGWNFVSMQYAKERGLLTNRGTALAADVTRYINGVYGYYTAGTSISASNNGITIIVKCTRGNKFHPNVNYHWEIFYESNN